MAAHPTKQQGHDWLASRRRRPRPLPDIKTIRRELGIELIEAQQDAAERAALQSDVGLSEFCWNRFQNEPVPD